MKNCFFRATISLSLIILFWQEIVSIFYLPNYILPTPLEVFTALVRSFSIIIYQASITLFETILGLLLGALFGMLFAILLIIIRPLRLFLLPLILLSQALPTFAIAPILVLWLGFGIGSKITMVVMMTFFPMTSALFDGFKKIPVHYLEMAKHMRGKKTQIMRYIYLPASGINSPQDLKRKRLGYSDSANEFPLLKAVLKSGGLTVNDVTLINVHYSLTQALMMGKIDVAAGMMRNVEPVVLQQHDFLPKMFYPEDFGIASYSELIYVAHTGEKTHERQAFLDALQEANQYLIKHPEESWERVINTYPQLNTPTNHAIWTKTVPLFSLDQHTTQKAKS